jgi:hypothetical protein
VSIKEFEIEVNNQLARFSKGRKHDPGGIASFLL